MLRGSLFIRPLTSFRVWLRHHFAALVHSMCRNSLAEGWEALFELRVTEWNSERVPDSPTALRAGCPKKTY